MESNFFDLCYGKTFVEKNDQETCDLGKINWVIFYFIVTLKVSVETTKEQQFWIN